MKELFKIEQGLFFGVKREFVTTRNFRKVFRVECEKHGLVGDHVRATSWYRNIGVYPRNVDGSDVTNKLLWEELEIALNRIAWTPDKDLTVERAEHCDNESKSNDEIHRKLDEIHRMVKYLFEQLKSDSCE